MEASSKTGFHCRLSELKLRSFLPPLSISQLVIFWVSSTPFLDLPLFFAAAIGKRYGFNYSAFSLKFIEIFKKRKKKKRDIVENLRRVP